MAREHTLESYTLGTKLGEGTFGVVRAAIDCITGQEVAIKLIPKGKMDPNMLKLEIENHSATCHKNVLQFLQVIETPQEHALVMEYASEGDLFDYIVKRIKVAEAEAILLFRQLIAAVAHCHEHSIAHRDIKPENILLNANMEVKLADFGLSAKFEKGVPLTKSVGSPNYAAPELLYRQCSYQGPEVDVWACGVVLYALLCGSLPFDASTHGELFRKIKMGIYKLPGHLSPEAKDLITRMLTRDPLERISILEVQKHAWLKQNSCVGGSDQQPVSMLPQSMPIVQSVEAHKPLCSTLRAFTCMGPSMRGRQDCRRHQISVRRSYTNCGRLNAKEHHGSHSRQAWHFF